eukprot:scaffold23471_cov141-Cylindrotheca_fusiformis.AAC.4
MKNSNSSMTFTADRLIALLLILQLAASATSANSPRFSIRLPGNSFYLKDWEDEDGDESSAFVGRGREYNIFKSPSKHNCRGGGIGDNLSEDDFVERYQRRYQRPSYQPNSRRRNNTPILVQRMQKWWRTSVNPKLESMPKIVCRVEPSTTLKLRKTFRPLKTIVRLGADFNTQLGVWQFKSSWEEPIIGGKLTLIGNELHITKSWRLYVGAVEDLVTRLRFRAAINLQTFQAYARVGFRTERLSPINVMEGFTVLKRLPLDGTRGNVKLEVKANVALPEPEIEYNTESQRSLVGMGDMEVSIDEMNLLLDY